MARKECRWGREQWFWNGNSKQGAEGGYLFSSTNVLSFLRNGTSLFLTVMLM